MLFNVHRSLSRFITDEHKSVSENYYYYYYYDDDDDDEDDDEDVTFIQRLIQPDWLKALRNSKQERTSQSNHERCIHQTIQRQQQSAAKHIRMSQNNYCNQDTQWSNTRTMDTSRTHNTFHQSKQILNGFALSKAFSHHMHSHSKRIRQLYFRIHKGL